MQPHDPNDPRNPRNAAIASPPPQSRPATPGQMTGAPAIGTSPIARFLAAPAIAAPPKQPRKPAAITAFNAVATANDAFKAPYIGAADATNRALVGARNFDREGLGNGNLVLIGNTHINDCEIYQAPTEPAPTLALGFTVVPLADMHVASEVAAHLGLPMPVLPAALVTQAGHA